jgi:hypothetical protein
LELKNAERSRYCNTETLSPIPHTLLKIANHSGIVYLVDRFNTPATLTFRYSSVAAGTQPDPTVAMGAGGQ